MVRSRDLIEVDIERDRGSDHNRKFYCDGNLMGKLLLDNISGIAGEMIKLLILIATGVVLLDRVKNSTSQLNTRVGALEQVDLFSTLQPAERQVLAAGLHEKRFAMGEAIVTQGQAGDSMYIIAEGRVQVSLGQDNIYSSLASLAAGDILGEMSLMTGEPRTLLSCAAVSVR